MTASELITGPIFRRGASHVLVCVICPLWRGLLAVAIGIVSVAWPNITVGAFVILFAVYAFIAAGSDTARAFSSARAGPVAGYLFLALLSFAAGLVALLWPGLTALVL